MLTEEQAKKLILGQVIYSTRFVSRAMGLPIKAKVTSIKTWKRKPEHVLVGYRTGSGATGKFSQYDLDDWSLDEEDALREYKLRQETLNRLYRVS